MLGLMNRSIQAFVHEIYGPAAWRAVAAEAGIDPEGVEAMLHYEDSLTEAVLDAIARRQGKPLEMVVEDFGAFLVSNPKFEPLRRLLRFSGETFADFLRSLDEIEGRIHLALPDLETPRLKLLQSGGEAYRLTCHWSFPRACNLVMGVLRSMADDYGALMRLDHAGTQEDGADVLTIELLDSSSAGGHNLEPATR
jgi:hypothetical protein